jgi:hypothetical protein
MAITNLTDRWPYLIPGLGVFITSLIMVVLIWVLDQKTTELQAQTLLLQNYRQDLSRLDQALATYPAHQSQIQQVGNTLPATYEEVAYAFSLIEAIAEDNRLQLAIHADQQAANEKGGVKSLRFTLKTTGSYAGLTNLLGEIAALPYHTRIDSIKFDHTNPPTATTVMRLYLKGVK